MADRERPSFEDSNNVTVQRCFFAYEYAKPFVEGKQTADIGCADGYGTQYLAQFSKSTIGVDYSESTLEIARKKHADKTNLSFIAGSVPPIPLESESVEVITSFQFIEHIHARPQFIKDAYRVLKPGGVFLCSTPNIKMSIARNPFHVFEYTFDEMDAAFKGVFDDFEIFGVQGNQKVNNYYEENAKWAKKILRLDPLGLHKIIPASWLVKPYNFLTTLMRNDLKNQNKETLEITTKDFFLTKENKDFTWDIFVVARKKSN